MGYEQITYADAVKLLNARFTAKNGKLPDLKEIKSRRDFDDDEHWQQSAGFIGQLPAGEDAAARTILLQKGFSPEPIITEVLDTHVENVLGDAPAISLEDPGKSETELAAVSEAVLAWYNRRKNTAVLADALRGARREQSRVLRCFIPSGNLSEGEGKISAPDLKGALDKIWFRSEPVEAGGVLIDEDTATELGLFLYKMRIKKTEVSLSEFSYIGGDGRTVWGTLSNNRNKLGEETAEPFDLGGHLPIYQLNTKALIANSVCRAQRAINLSGTMLTQNNNLAGSRERLAVGVQPPGEWVDRGTRDGETVKEFVPKAMRTGAGTFNFLSARELFDADGLTKALANPNVIFTDPVPINTFVGTSDHWRRVIYSKAKMLHLLMAENATASGKSRIEARREFQSSLNESKEAIDPAGAWMIETALRAAAEFMGKPGLFAATTANFRAQVSTVELTPEENAQIREDFKAGLIDHRTALELRQIKNVDEVLERIAANSSSPPTV